ncbi:hypothetical protein [Rahnella sp. PCH160]
MSDPRDARFYHAWMSRRDVSRRGYSVVYWRQASKLPDKLVPGIC